MCDQFIEMTSNLNRFDFILLDTKNYKSDYKITKGRLFLKIRPKNKIKIMVA